MRPRRAEGFVLLEVLLAALILTAGIFVLFESFSGALRMARTNDEWMRESFTLEAGLWQWEKTGQWPPEESSVRHEETSENSLLKGTLYVRLQSSGRDKELSLSAYR